MLCCFQTRVLPASSSSRLRAFPSSLAVPAVLAVLAGFAPAAGAQVESAASEVSSFSSNPPSSSPGAGTATSCTLAGLLERVRTSPRADAIAGQLAAASALEAQAGVRPNPRLGVEGEDFTGSGAYSDLGQSQTTVAISQPIELGGRRSSRVALAARQRAAEQVRALREGVRAEVVAKQALVTLLAAREELAIRTGDVDLVREVLTRARARADRGAGSQAEVEQASIAAATEAQALSDAERAVLVAEQRLVSLWGGQRGEAACFAAELALSSQPDLPAGDDTLESNPAIATAEADIAVQRAEVAMARARISPDLTVAAGVRYLAGSDDVTMVTRLQVELPLFDRNSGNVQAAEQGLFASQARARIARQEAEFAIFRVREATLAAHRRASMLGREAIPAARRVYATQQRAWRSGAASYLELVAARRTLLALQLDRLDALVEYHGGRAALEGFGGQVSANLPTINPDPVRPTETARTAR